MNTNIRAWHSDPALKSDAITRMRAHAEADEIIGGVYLNIDPGTPGGYRACHIGCLVVELDETTREAIAAGREAEPDDGWHAAAERLLGLPQRYSHLFEGIFEALPDAERSGFAVALTEAIPVGANLDRVVDEMTIALLSDPEHGCRQYADPAAQSAIDTVVALCRRRRNGDTPTVEEWSAARVDAAARYAAAAAASARHTVTAARYAAAAAARYAAAADAAAAARHTAARYVTAADAAAEAAAAATAWSAAQDSRYDARVGARLWQAATLIRLTRNAR